MNNIIATIDLNKLTSLELAVLVHIVEKADGGLRLMNTNAVISAGLTLAGNDFFDEDTVEVDRFFGSYGELK